MFPLGSVVFPNSAIPLRIFEDRYQVLLDRVVAGDRRFGTVLIERGFEVGGGDARFGTGTLLELAGIQDLDGGHRAVVVAGIERIRVAQWLDDDPHPWAEIELLPDEAELRAPDLETGRRQLARVLALASEMGADVAGFDTSTSDDPGVASYQLAALCPVTALDSQRLLEAPGPVARVEMAIEMLEAQAALLEARLGDS
jgi:uncharacterized protein